MTNMLDILEAVSTDLGPTRTYKVRSMTFIPAKPEYRQQTGLVGNLLVKLQHGRGHHCKFETASYGVERDATPEPGDHGGAAFWLVKFNSEQERPYRCVVGGLTPKCDCKSSQCKIKDEEGELVCRHASALRWLIENNIIEGS